mmetsp:Transcript_21667/g.61655  ORF Transcript_21667/g.61655 Transcript_21667/m.61655 type:complete len:260 (-) Transcript_21667:433-1212(-)
MGRDPVSCNVCVSQIVAGLSEALVCLSEAERKELPVLCLFLSNQTVALRLCTDLTDTIYTDVQVSTHIRSTHAASAVCLSVCLCIYLSVCQTCAILDDRPVVDPHVEATQASQTQQRCRRQIAHTGSVYILRHAGQAQLELLDLWQISRPVAPRDALDAHILHHQHRSPEFPVAADRLDHLQGLAGRHATTYQLVAIESAGQLAGELAAKAARQRQLAENNGEAVGQICENGCIALLCIGRRQQHISIAHRHTHHKALE